MLIRINTLVPVLCRSKAVADCARRVTNITTTEIHCGPYHFDRKTGQALNEVTDCYIPDMDRRVVDGPDGDPRIKFSAQEARDLRDQSLNGLKGFDARPVLWFVHERIRQAAREGKSKITYPLRRGNDDVPFPKPWPTPENLQAIERHPDVINEIWASLESEGYDVVHKPDQPLEDGKFYTTVSW